MKIFLNILLLVLLFAFACKKGNLTTLGTEIGGKNFTRMPSTGPGNTYGSYSGGSQAADTSENNYNPPPTPTVAVSTIKYNGTTYTVNVGCQSSSSYYGISGVNSSPAFTCVLYFKDKPTTSGSYSIEDIGGTSPSGATKVWLTVNVGSVTYVATSGSVYVTVSSSGKVTADFPSTTATSISTSASVTVSGTLTCNN